MAAIHYVTNPETKKVISLSTKNVVKLQISTDINRNRVSFDLWNISFRAAVNEYAALLEETPPTIQEWAQDYPSFSPDDVGAAYARALMAWQDDDMLVSNAIINTCDFSGDPSGEYMGEIAALQTAKERFEYLQNEFQDVSDPKKQDELIELWPTLPILPQTRPFTRRAIEYNVKTSYRNWLLIDGNTATNMGQFVRFVYRKLREDKESATFVSTLEAISTSGGVAVHERNIKAFARAIGRFYPDP